MKWRLPRRGRQGLRPSTRVDEAAWIGPPDARFGFTIADLVRGGFPAYVRVLHPARSRANTSIRWATVADWSGRTLHNLAQFHTIANPVDGQPGAPPWGSHQPDTGNLAIPEFRTLCDLLRRHTSTPNECLFCLWEGYGWLHGSPASATMVFVPEGYRGSLPVPQPIPPAFPPEVLDGPKVERPTAPISCSRVRSMPAGNLGHTVGRSFFPQSPNLFWPKDRAWLVASEIDLYCTVVAGSERLAQALLVDPRLEAWRVQPTDSITYDSDRVNA